MKAILSVAAEKANSRAATATAVPKYVAVLSEVCRRIWPVKTAANLASVTGRSERSAEFWLSATYDMSLENAAKLLRSEHGYDFLAAIMKGSSTKWWVRVELAYEVGATNRAIRAQERKLEKLKEKRQQIEMDL